MPLALAQESHIVLENIKALGFDWEFAHSMIVGTNMPYLIVECSEPKLRV